MKNFGRKKARFHHFSKPIKFLLAFGRAEFIIGLGCIGQKQFRSQAQNFTRSFQGRVS
jgi:hypothetical protein